MYNESDTHSGCEACGKILTVHFTRNIGFYCDNCRVGQQARVSQKEENALIENIGCYLSHSIDKKLSRSNYFYFKKTYLKLFMSLSKHNKRKAIALTLNTIRALKYYSESEKTFFLENKSIINSITNLLIVNRNRIKT